MSKAVLFVRVSTLQQHLESQEEVLKRRALSDGFANTDIITIGKKESGYKLDEEEREGLKELDEVITQEDVSTVYIWELSRLSRRPKVLYSVRDKLFEKHIQLICLNPSFTLLTSDLQQFDSTATLIFSLFGALAEQEVIQKKERFARGKKRLAELGRYNGGKIPIGYKKDEANNNFIDIDPEGAAMVHEIFDMYERGVSQPRIAKEFYNRGYKDIKISTVHQILTNELLTGKPHKSPAASYVRQYPQIITEEQFNRCRKIAGTNNTNADKTSRIYYAHHIVKCHVCGRYLTGTAIRGTYFCHDAHNYNKKYDGYDGVPMCTNKTHISINLLDSLLWHVAIKLEEEFILTSAQARLTEYQNELEIVEQKNGNIKNRLDAVEGKRQRLLEAYADGLSPDNYKKKRALLEKEKQDIQREGVSYGEQIRNLKRMIKEVAESICVYPDEDSIIRQEINLIDQIAAIDSDEKRQDLIKKHIKEVTAENRLVRHKHQYVKEKDCRVKLITITPTIGPKQYYCYFPFDGHGGKLVYRSDAECNLLGQVYYEYLDRYRDARKKDRNEREKQETAKRQATQKKLIETERLIDVTEMERRFPGLTRSGILYAIETGKMPARKMGCKWFTKESDFEKYKEWYFSDERSGKGIKRKNRGKDLRKKTKQ